MSIGTRIVSVRGFRRMTQDQLGGLVGVTKQTVSGWERDPGNEHDEWAVWVLGEDGRRLGYVDRRYSRQVAEALEAGEELVGLVMSEYDPDDPEPPEVWVKTAPEPATGFWANHVGLAVALVLLALAVAAWLAVSSCVRGILA